MDDIGEKEGVRNHNKKPKNLIKSCPPREIKLIFQKYFSTIKKLFTPENPPPLTGIKSKCG